MYNRTLQFIFGLSFILTLGLLCYFFYLLGEQSGITKALQELDYDDLKNEYFEYRKHKTFEMGEEKE